MNKKPLNMMDMGVRPKKEDKVGQVPLEKTMIKKYEGEILFFELMRKDH